MAAEIESILDEYADDITEGLEEITTDVAKAGAKAIRASARSMFGGTGKYASGWTQQVEKKGYWTKATIYNSKTPGLPHLLEYGHAKVNGGRVAGRAHIEPVERQIAEQFERKVVAEIT
jgi:hypothetical protein